MAVARVAGELQLENGQQRHEPRRALAGAEFIEPRHQIRAENDRLAASSESRSRRSRSVAAELQAIGGLGQMVAPPSNEVAQALIRQGLALPNGEVRVLDG